MQRCRWHCKMSFKTGRVPHSLIRLMLKMNKRFDLTTPFFVTILSASAIMEGQSDMVDIKIHFKYHGSQRCSLIDCAYSKLYEMNFTDFLDYMHGEVPQLTRLDPIKRYTFLDGEGTYVDLTARNFHRFLRMSCAIGNDVPKINIKILEGASPAPKLSASTRSLGESSHSNLKSRKALELEYNDDEFVKIPYKSPMEIDLNLKRQEANFKETELRLVDTKYDELVKRFNPVLCNQGTKSLCNRCHLRMGHNKNRCHMAQCDSASLCGLVDKHPDEKKELMEVGKQKQRLEAELKSINFDLQTKERAINEVSTSFEAKVHEILINSNPAKYLTEQNRPKEGIILSDSFILKKFYGKNKVTKEILENDSATFQVIIDSYHEKMKTEKVKNSVVKELEMSTGQRHGDIMSALNGPSTTSPWPMFPFVVPQFQQMFDVGQAYRMFPGNIPLSPMTTPPPIANPPLPVSSPPPPPQDE